jgi:hypothetical protein
MAVAAARLFPTYTTFTATFDEPLHIADGMEWLDKGTYTYEHQHPPLARIAVSLGPYLSGLRSHSLKETDAEGNAILFSNGRYFQNLRLARLGNLPFLFLGCVVVFLWARRWFSGATAFCSVLFFTLTPPILGHAGLATLDMAAAATVILALYQFLRWMEQPTWLRAGLLGLALAAAFLSKFSSFAFLPVCFAAVGLLIAIRERRKAFTIWKTRVAHIAMIAIVTFTAVWAGYRFSREPVRITRGGKPLTSAQIENPIFRAAFSIAEAPLPLVELASGLQTVYKHNKYGHGSYLLGEYRLKGWWYFFPLVLAVKTPIGLLALTFAGWLLVFLKPKSSSWQQKATGIFPVLILIVCMSSRINLGVRHLLVIYPLISILAGRALTAAFTLSRRPVITAIAVGLAAWTAVESVNGHPDYLAYFNPLASRNPERVLAESDLDWGQDLHRLAARLGALGVQEVGISYFGTAPLDRVGLPRYRALSPTNPTSGYIAISVHDLMMTNAENGSFEWLKSYRPIERIGKSIFLFHIEN